MPSFALTSTNYGTFSTATRVIASNPGVDTASAPGFHGGAASGLGAVSKPAAWIIVQKLAVEKPERVRTR